MSYYNQAVFDAIVRLVQMGFRQVLVLPGEVRRIDNFLYAGERPGIKGEWVTFVEDSIVLDTESESFFTEKKYEYVG